MSTSTMPIDTQQMVHELTAAGIAQGHADAMVSVIAGTFGRYHAFLLDGVATKCDLDHAVAELRSDLEKLQSELDHAVAKLQSDLDRAVARLDAKIDAVAASNDSAISRLKAALIKWIVSAGLFQGGLIVALVLKLAD